MTGPNRARRWLAVQGILLVVMGMGMVVQNRISEHQNDTQDQCQRKQFAALAASNKVRSELNGRDTDATNKVILSIADAKTSEDVRDALAEFKETQAKISKIRQKNPVPDFPTGSCNR
jgi:hypothetical protein